MLRLDTVISCEGMTSTSFFNETLTKVDETSFQLAELSNTSKSLDKSLRLETKHRLRSESIKQSMSGHSSLGSTDYYQQKKGEKIN